MDFHRAGLFVRRSVEGKNNLCSEGGPRVRVAGLTTGISPEVVQELLKRAQRRGKDVA